MDLNSVIGARIKEMRESRGITQNEMGRMIGHTDVYVSQIETGKRRIGLDLLEKISGHLEVSPLIFFREAWQADETTDQVSTLVRRVDQLRGMVEDLTRVVADLSERRRIASEPDPVTSAITSTAQSLDLPVRQLLLEIAHAIQANPAALQRTGIGGATSGTEAAAAGVEAGALVTTP